jgi:hypothetical protein
MTQPAAAPRALLAPVRSTFRAVARTVVPDTAALDETGWSSVEAIVEDALAARPPRMRRQIVLFIRLIDWLARARHGHAFRDLDERARGRILQRLQSSPVLLLRRGFWGLRTLVFMGWYAQPSTADRIGYRAGRRGWGDRPGEVPRTPLTPVARAHDLAPPSGSGGSPREGATRPTP